MNMNRRNSAAILLIIGWLLSGCGPSPALWPTTTLIPLGPTPDPTMAQVSIPTDLMTPAPTPTELVTAVSFPPAVEGTYTINGSSPDGKAYSRKLTITLNSENSGGSKKQPIYQLAWDDGTNGVGILIKDARATNFLAASFGGSSCGAVFYSIDPATIMLTGTRLKLNKPEIGSETASPTIMRSTLEGDYDLKGFNTNGSEYKGTLSITRHGMENVWQLTWNVMQPYDGIGISINKSLFAAAFGGEGCGVSVDEVKEDGSLHATWAIWAGHQVGEETAIK